MMTNIKLAGYQPHGSLLSQTLKLFSDFLKKHLPDTVSIKITNNIMDLGHAPGAWPDAIESGKGDAAVAGLSALEEETRNLAADVFARRAAKR